MIANRTWPMVGYLSVLWAIFVVPTAYADLQCDQGQTVCKDAVLVTTDAELQATAQRWPFSCPMTLSPSSPAMMNISPAMTRMLPSGVANALTSATL